MRLSTKTPSILFAFLIMGCQSAKPDNVPPVKVLFEHANVNKEYRVDVTIEETNKYSVNMEYYLEEPEEYKFFSSKKVTARDIEDSHRLGKILGLKYEDVFKDTGVPARYHIKIYDQQKHELIIEKTVSNPETNGVYIGRYATLASSNLDEGEYIVYITYLGGSIELNSVYAKTVIMRSHHGK